MPKTILQGHTLKRKQDAQGFWYHVELAGASVEIRDESTGALAPLWADRDGTIGMPNPFTSDSEARFETYTNPGHYRARAFDGSGNEVIVNYIRQGTAAAKDYGTADGELPQAENVVQNKGATPSIMADVVANRPAAGVAGRWFHATDENRIYRDDGASWGLIASGAESTDALLGLVELATQAEVDGEADATRVITPATLGGWTMSQAFKDANDIGGGNVLLQTVTASNQASVVLGDGGQIDGTFKKYIVEIISLVADTDAVYAIMRTSSDGGSTFDSGASDYAAFDIGRDAGSGAIGNNNNSLSEMRLTGTSNFGNASGESLAATITVRDPANASLETMFSWQVDMIAPDTATRGHWGGGRRKQAAVVDAIEFTLSSGNISSATVKLYGVP